MSSSLALGAALLGALGATHCVAMCGGFAGLSQAGARAASPDVAVTKLARKPATGARGALLLGAQNVGRVSSYVLFGALAGGFGARAGGIALRGQTILEIVSGALLIGVGLFLVGLFPGYALVERLGVPLHRAVSPLARRLLPLRTAKQAFLFGLTWGLLPCGLVYSALGLAAASGGALAGAVVMLGFGAGTLPALLSMGILARTVADLARRPWARRVAGAALVVFGVVHFSAATQRLTEPAGEPACPMHANAH
ncbi:MAG: sulfite exporter TauE/SafE family protein [Polyangiaceae bacterium]